MNGSGWLPPTASRAAEYVDALFLALTIGSGMILLLVAALVIGFAVRFRRGAKAPHADLPKLVKSEVEIGWTLATLLTFLAIFAWAASQNFSLGEPRPDPLEIRVVAKQWMWKAQHSGGEREIDALHIPVGQPVRILLNSQDVIHSFYVPAFRVKKDAVPGTTQELWIEPHRTGTFRLTCAEFCGTSHSEMTGKIVVMEPAAYADWLEQQETADDLARQGEDLFRALGCSGCHERSTTVRAPDLRGLYGRPVPLADGRVVVADEQYIRNSILQPRRAVAAGYEPIMPSFAGRISEAELVSIVAYIKSLSVAEGEMR